MLWESSGRIEGAEFAAHFGDGSMFLRSLEGLDTGGGLVGDSGWWHVEDAFSVWVFILIRSVLLRNLYRRSHPRLRFYSLLDFILGHLLALLH